MEGVNNIEGRSTTVLNQTYSDNQSAVSEKSPSDWLGDIKDPGQQHTNSTNSCQVSTNNDVSCGMFCWRPSCLKKAAHPVAILVCVCLLVLSQSILASGYISSIVTTIERRYNLLSSQSGIVLSSYEFTCLLGVVVVSFYGERFNRARILGVGAIVMAVGSFIFTLPHFLSQHYVVKQLDNSSQQQVTCSNATNEGEDGSCYIGAEETWALAVFVIAQLVIGWGASPVYILGPTYIHDNVSRSWFPVFIGVVYATGALGPAVGFLLGAAFVSFYVDLPLEPPGGLTEDDLSRWVGAWWLGFLVVMVMLLIAGFLMMMFPRRLASVESAGCNEMDRMAFGDSCADIPAQVKSVFTQYTWLFISLAVVTEQSVVTGFINFIAKFTQTTFSLPASQANIIAGGVLIPAAALGILTGGIIMKRCRPSVVIALRYMLITSAVSLVAVASLMFFTCDTISLTGVTTSYSGSSNDNNLASPCNANCSCASSDYQPVCGGDLLTYFSACHAGCQQVSQNAMGSTQINFSSCSCIADSLAVSGRCPSTCSMLIPFLVVLFITIFIICLGHNPAMLITLHSVGDHQRSFALGAQYFLVRIIAFIPTPIYFGLLFDSQCIVWDNRCGQQGACLEYDVRNLPYVMFGVICALKVLTLIFCAAVYLAARRLSFKNKLSPSTSNRSIHVSASTTDSIVTYM